ncbi:MAG: class I SAM-dependent methyltransferase [Alphaproteobacteria bacterium]|nr:class I SAM-dependent methyltransferase [Alphaproteobacteria bacterium]
MVEDTPLKADFTSGAVVHRLRFGGGRGQALPRAIGLKNGKTPDVVDATAGLGRDGFLLASLGAKVTLIERSDHMHRLLAEGLAQARDAGGEVAEIVARISLLHGDAKDLLPGLTPEVVLVDPMHPPRHNSALVKKELRQIRDIVGTDDDALALMQAALGCARNRVVLKWPQKADAMTGLRMPSHRINGKSTRYDVFMTL